MRLPSGDQTEPASDASPNVNRLSTARPRLSNQTLSFPFTVRSSATRCPSGEIEGKNGRALSGSPTFSTSLPL